MPGYVYIMASQKNGTLYIGVTTDLSRRVFEHRNGLLPGFTAEARLQALGLVRGAFRRARGHSPRANVEDVAAGVEGIVDRESESGLERALPRHGVVSVRTRSVVDAVAAWVLGSSPRMTMFKVVLDVFIGVGSEGQPHQDSHSRA
jgi:hypothetical protein